jgi:Sulfotransferase family
MTREIAHESSTEASQPAPVFIIGLPRSGTTLFYQLLLNYFDWSYFTRWCDFFYRNPVIAHKIQHLLFPKPKQFAYESEYGHFKHINIMSMPWSPVEGHAIWRRWFPQFPDDVVRDRINADAETEIRSVVAGFIETAGKPFLNKNGAHVVRLSALAQIFPRAVFIVLQRQSEYIAQSLYIARVGKRQNRRENRWWGTKPVEYDTLKYLDPLKQAVGQTQALETAMERQLLTNHRHIRVDYRDVCEAPGKVLDKVFDACRKYGVELRRTQCSEPKPFGLQNERKISESEFSQIKALLFDDSSDSNRISAVLPADS